MVPLPALALVTAAHNEQEHLAKTLESVLAQTVPPRRWIIVDDSSTDRTAAIVQAYADRHSWITLERLTAPHARNFASKGRAINAGYAAIASEAFDVLGILDGDVSFAPDYFEFLLERFQADLTLGVSGTSYIEGSCGPPDYSLDRSGHVPGQCQFFRRACFEKIGRYQPMPAGGEDTIAVTTARMLGWRTRAWTEKTFVHHRPMGTSGSDRWRAAFQMGRRDYLLGGHPIWELARSAYQMRHPPRVIGGGLLLLGYLWAALRRENIPVSKAFRDYRRQEQLRRLREWFRRKESRPEIPLKPGAAPVIPQSRCRPD